MLIAAKRSLDEEQLSPEVISRSKLVSELETTFVNANINSESNECSICYEPLSDGRKVVKLPCHPTHVCHSACIEPWLCL
jgi:hypothetical protein